MAFSCPRCGSAVYRVGKDGLRECQGVVADVAEVRLVKPEFMTVDASTPTVATDAPTVQHRHERRCNLWWEEADDARYGVET